MLRGESADTPWSIGKHATGHRFFPHVEAQNLVIVFRAFSTASHTSLQEGEKGKGSRHDFRIQGLSFLSNGEGRRTGRLDVGKGTMHGKKPYKKGNKTK